MAQLVSGRTGTLSRQAGTQIRAGSHCITHSSGVDQSEDSCNSQAFGAGAEGMKREQTRVMLGVLSG